MIVKNIPCWDFVAKVQITNLCLLGFNENKTQLDPQFHLDWNLFRFDTSKLPEEFRLAGSIQLVVYLYYTSSHQTSSQGTAKKSIRSNQAHITIDPAYQTLYQVQFIIPIS